MIRAASRPLTVILARKGNSVQNVRLQSSSSGGGGVGKLIVTSIVAGAGLAGGTVGYASIDKDFRILVQDSVPGSKDVLEAILGPAESEETKVAKPKKSEAVPPSKMKVHVTSSPPMPEIPKPPEVKKVVESTPKSAEKKVEDVKIESKPVATSAPVQEPKVSGQAESVGLELALEEGLKNMEVKMKSALENSKAAIEATKHHMTLVREVMDDSSPKDEKRAWNEVFEAANTKSHLLKETEKCLNEAKTALNSTIDSIETGRKNPVTQDNPALKAAEDKAKTAVAELQKVVSSLDAVKKEAKLVDDYRSLVEEGRQQFQKEIEAILPGMSLSQKSGGLSEEELNIFMTHAYRKVCQLQDELARLQTFNKRSEGGSSIASDNLDVQSELDAQRRELEVEHHRKLSALREEMEKEMRTQLRRQAAAHADHINDVLEVQAKELNRLHERSLDESLTNERTTHKRELANIKGSLEGLNKAMEDKSFMSNVAFESQEFWLACVALQKTVEEGIDNETLASKIKALEAAVEKSVAFQKDDLIQSLLQSIPQAAKSQGVPPCGEIKTRFSKVEEMAKRTALVGEDGGSLLLFGLSYLQNLLVISPRRSAPPKNEPLDVEALNTFDIVWLARSAMETDDLEQAIKYMNLLKGEPKRQASDWLQSATVYLEMQQLCQALASYASAIGAEARPALK